MKEAVEEGFGAMMAMRPPDGEERGSRETGMGTWLPMVACLVGEMGMGRRRRWGCRWGRRLH